MFSSGSYPNIRCTATDNGGAQCGQYLSFDVLGDFKRLYEKKLDEIDRDGGGDCLELKNLVQKKWIEDLTEQTEMMAKVIKELENEATERVRKLEEKLDQSAKCACAKTSYLESDIRNLLEFIGRVRDDGRWSIDGLQFYNVEYSDLFGGSPNYSNKRACERGIYPREKEVIPINGNNNDDEATRLSKELEYLKSFGNIEEMSRELKKKTAEFDALKQAMFDMRAALTEEVACKHDMISALRKDTQQLEERCLQADKQTAFKDDIIKELRKEIKQMKQQDHVEKEEIAEMKKKIGILTLELKKIKDEQNVEHSCIELTTNCENIDSVCDGDATVCFENCNCRSCKKLKSEGESDCNDSRARTQRQRLAECKCSDNCTRKELQNKNEIIQVQNDTLEMLQDQLQACKEREVKLIEDIHLKEIEMHDLRTKCENLEHALVHMQERAENLERADQTTKLKNEIKKLRHEKRVYEQVVVYFKGEMGVMSEQLKNLQEILQMSTKTTKEENVQLSKNVAGLQEMNLRLRNEVLNTEKRLEKDSWQMQVKEARIGELEAMVVKKNEELDMHDEAVRLLRKKLENAVLQIHKLEAVIQALNTNMMQLQLNNKSLELEIAEKSKSDVIVCSRSVTKITKDLRKKNEKLERLMEEHCAQTRIFEATKRELEKMKRQFATDKSNEANLKRKCGEIKSKMSETEHRNQKLRDDLSNIYAQVEQLGQRERERENELLKYKNVCGQLKTALDDLNQNLKAAKGENMSLREKVKKHHNQSNKEQENCACEINRAKQVIKELEEENCSLKKAASDQMAKYEHMEKQFCALRREIKGHVEKLHKAQRALVDAQVENSSLKKDIEQKDGRALGIKKIYEEVQMEKQCACKELRKKDAEIENLKARCAQSENADCDRCQAMEQLLQQSQEREKRLSQSVNQLKQEVFKLTNQNSMQSSQCKCELQFENEALKREIQGMIDNQMALNAENDKLLREVSELQSVLVPLQAENEKLAEQVKEVARQNKELLNDKNEIYNELKCIECCYRDLEKDHKSIAASMQCLEKELRSTRTNRDDLCVESKHVINNVKRWLEEQKKVNEQNQMQSKNYLNLIDQLKKENKKLLDQLRMSGASPPPMSTACTCNDWSAGEDPYERVGTTWYSDAPESDMSDGKNINWLSATPCDYYAYSDEKDTYPSLGYSSDLCECPPRSSPGSSFDDGLSSLASCSIEEYYCAPNYRDDDETDLTDDYTKKTFGGINSTVNRPHHDTRPVPPSSAYKNQSKSPHHAHSTSPESNNYKCQSKCQQHGHSASPESNDYKIDKNKTSNCVDGKNQSLDSTDKSHSPDHIGQSQRPDPIVKSEGSYQAQPNQTNVYNKNNSKSHDKSKTDPDCNDIGSSDRNSRSSPWSTPYKICKSSCRGRKGKSSSPGRKGASCPDKKCENNRDKKGESSPDQKGKSSPDKKNNDDREKKDDSPDRKDKNLKDRHSPYKKGERSPSRKDKSNSPDHKTEENKDDSSSYGNQNKRSDNKDGKCCKKKDCKCPFRSTEYTPVYKVQGKDCRCKNKKK